MSTTPAAAPATTSSDGVPPFLEVKNLVKEFPVTRGAVLQRTVGAVHAVSDVSFKVRPGETFGLVGESGCGKTTTGRMVVALEPPTSGSIIIAGEDIARMSHSKLRTKRRDMQMMFQDPYASLDPRMRVVTILREPLAIQGIGNKKSQVDRCAELAQRRRSRARRARPLSARVQRWPAPAHRTRARAGAQPEVDRRGRTGVGARRVDSIADPQHDERPAGEVRPDLRHHLPRPVGGEIHVRPNRRHVPREDGRDRERRATLSEPAHPYTKGLVSAIPIPDPDIERTKDRDAPKGEIPSAINPPSGCRFRTRCPFAQHCAPSRSRCCGASVTNHEAACHFPLKPPVDAAA